VRTGLRPDDHDPTRNPGPAQRGCQAPLVEIFSISAVVETDGVRVR